jgi:hypothetical protein
MMRLFRHSILLVFLVSVAVSTLPAAQSPSPVLIPQPAKLTWQEGSFVLQPKTTVRVAKSETDIAQTLVEAITDKKLLFARPHVLSAARVRENWFSGSN